MKYLPISFVLALAVLCVVIGMPPSALSKVAAALLGIALLYFGFRAKASAARTLAKEKYGTAEGSEGGTPLDKDLVASILDTFKIEPSDHLREILAPSVAGKWSPEALQAARSILEQRSNKTAAEPAYRTVPRSVPEQTSREKEAIAPGLSRLLLALDVGSRVYCRWRNESGTIIRWHDQEERFYIRYDDGEGEWATLGMFE